MTSADGSPVPDYGAMLRLDGRTFVVLGAGQGIGRQAAHALASQGAYVVCVDLDERLAGEIAAEVGGTACVADARKASEVERVVDETVGQLGALDGVVDIIGVARWAALVDMPEDDWDWCHDMVVRHAFHVVKYAGRAMSANGRGTMVFVASISGISSAPFHAAYGAAKAGLMSLVRSAAIELRPTDIRVNAVAPGVIATPPRRLLSGGRRRGHGQRIARFDGTDAGHRLDRPVSGLGPGPLRDGSDPGGRRRPFDQVTARAHGSSGGGGEGLG